MRKEVIFAIAAGIIFGLIVALGVWRANSALDKKTPVTKQSDTVSDINNDTPTSELAISEPEDYDVVTESPVYIKGLVSPNTFVALYSSEESKIVYKIDSNLSESIELSPGTNLIKVSAFTPSGQRMDKTIKVVYSSEFTKYMEEQIITPTDEATTATDEASEVREKVREKLEFAKSNPKAFIGDITDKTDTSIQIKNGDGQIKQISINKETTYAKIGTTTKSITSEDVAIGDHLIAMGFVDQSNVLDAKRVLITDVQKDPGNISFFGQASDLANKSFQLNTDNEDLIINLSKYTDYQILINDTVEDTTYKDVEDGDTLIVVGLKEGSEVSAEVIQVVKKAEIPNSTPEE